MRQLRNLCKRDKAFQQDAPRQWVEFPSGSSWISVNSARFAFTTRPWTHCHIDDPFQSP
jgi:hypothetical protein